MEITLLSVRLNDLHFKDKPYYLRARYVVIYRDKRNRGNENNCSLDHSIRIRSNDEFYFSCETEVFNSLLPTL